MIYLLNDVNVIMTTSVVQSGPAIHWVHHVHLGTNNTYQRLTEQSNISIVSNMFKCEKNIKLLLI